MWLKLSKVSPVLLSSEDSDFVLITGSKFSPLQVVLRPSELLNALLLEEVFCELEERDFERKSSKFSLLLSVSVPCDFVRDSIRDVPNDQNKTRDCPRCEIKKLKRLHFIKVQSCFKENILFNYYYPAESAKDCTNNSNQTNLHSSYLQATRRWFLSYNCLYFCLVLVSSSSF